MAMRKIIYFIPLLFFACVQNQQEKPSQKPVYNSLDSLFQTLHADSLFNGTVLVQDHGEIVYQDAIGIAEKESNRNLSTQTPFYLGSLAKQFTAVATLLLVEDGKLSLDDPINQHLSDLPTAVSEINTHHLLSHTSGLPDYYDAGVFKTGMTNQDVWEYINTLDSLDFKPGSAYDYSNSAYVLLSILVEKLSGKPYKTFLKERVFAPLKMNNTVAFDQESEAVPNRAIGYTQEGEKDDYNAFTTGGGGIFSNILDLHLWNQAIDEPGFINDSLLTRAHQPTILSNGTKSYYGMGWMIGKEVDGTIFHSGSLAGFRTYMYRSPKQQRCIILLSNFTNNVAEINEQILEILN